MRTEILTKNGMVMVMVVAAAAAATFSRLFRRLTSNITNEDALLLQCKITTLTNGRANEYKIYMFMLVCGCDSMQFNARWWLVVAKIVVI